jgi:hypothetical protein
MVGAGLNAAQNSGGVLIAQVQPQWSTIKSCCSALDNCNPPTEHIQPGEYAAMRWCNVGSRVL